MGTVNIRVDESLEQTLRNLQEEVMKETRKEFPKLDIRLPATITSQIAAAKLNGKNKISFRIRKIGLNKGFIELL